MNNQASLFDYVRPQTAPYQRHSDTSKAAAERIAPVMGAQQARVLAFLRGCGSHGATDEEICDGTGIKGSTERPRRGELVGKDLIEESGEKRPTHSGYPATVWRVK